MTAILLQFQGELEQNCHMEYGDLSHGIQNSNKQSRILLILAGFRPTLTVSIRDKTGRLSSTAPVFHSIRPRRRGQSGSKWEELIDLV